MLLLVMHAEPSVLAGPSMHAGSVSVCGRLA
jgi:hypothetical protein